MFGLRAFIVIEEIGPPHLRNLMFQRKFRSTLIDEPPSRDRGIHQLLAAAQGSPCGTPRTPHSVRQSDQRYEYVAAYTRHL